MDVRVFAVCVLPEHIERTETLCSPLLPGADKERVVGMLRALHAWKLLQLRKAVSVVILRFLQQLLSTFFPVSIARFVAVWGCLNARAFYYFSKFSSWVKADSLVFLWHFNSLIESGKPLKTQFVSTNHPKDRNFLEDYPKPQGLAFSPQSWRLFSP